ncbi:hypothetical protein [Amycolatopsis australiensis]|uniref:Uncharacterized protein n=1 Tax=Amycolatopsis australiensis TaxID=546364 RepID=A0A1K1QZS2_9PSEU|nr:hypothetical protein [Amycolatopsis australiensis]SFW65384.1 hypothetical protein SAMN04489730_2477 [Amycolatopsis australiensis]
MITATVVVSPWVTPESGGLKRGPLARTGVAAQVVRGAAAVIEDVGDAAKVYM